MWAEAAWLFSVVNAHADKLSRDTDTTDWGLDRRVFQALDHDWGPTAVDCFATVANTRLPRFNSLMEAPGTEAVIGWSQSWRRATNYVNPPISQASLILPMIQRDHASAVVILPEWPAIPWWRPTLMAADAAFYLPSDARLFTHGRWATPARRPRWRIVALFLQDVGRPSTVWNGGMPPTPAPWPPLAPPALAPRRRA